MNNSTQMKKGGAANSNNAGVYQNGSISGANSTVPSRGGAASMSQTSTKKVTPTLNKQTSNP